MIRIAGVVAGLIIFTGVLAVLAFVAHCIDERLGDDDLPPPEHPRTSPAYVGWDGRSWEA